MKETYLFDRDNLRQVFGWRKAQELLAQHKFSTVRDLCSALIQERSAGSQYVIGLPWVGKSTFAMKELGAKEVKTQQDMKNILTGNFDDMVFVTCNVEDDIARNAKQITLLHTSEDRLRHHRVLRDELIESWDSDTSFGREAGTTAYALTEDDVIISRLKTDYASKSNIIFYNSSDVANFEQRKYIPVATGISERKKYIEQWIVLSSWKFAPIHTIHEMMLRQGYQLAQEENLPFVVVMVRNSGKDYDFALTQREKKQLLECGMRDMDIAILSETPDYLKIKHQVVKVDRAQSFVFLGKERLPEGFTEGSTEALFSNPAHEKFLKSLDSYAVHRMKWAYFFNIGDIAMEDSEESVSATFVRRNLVEGNVQALVPYLSEEVFKVLTLPQNLQAIKRRYVLEEQRKAAETRLKEELNQKYKSVHPITKQPLLKKDGTPKLLDKRVVTKDTPRDEKERVLNYLEAKTKLMNKKIRKQNKSYKEKIYAEKNKLQFPV